MNTNSMSYKCKQFFMFAGLSTAVFAAVVLLPFIYGLYLTFTSWDGVSSQRPFVGITNYLSTFADGAYWQSLGKTMLYSAIAVILVNVVAFILSAKDFLNWLVFEADGNAFLTEKCALVPAYSNINADSLDPLSISVKKYADAGKLIGNYNYAPDDHIPKLGAEFQRYLADQIDRAGFAKTVEDYWASSPVVQ